MRTRRGHLREVGLDGSEYLVFGLAEEICELSLVDTVVVDLLVVEPGGANQLVWPELKQELWAQTGIGGQLPILGQPLGERSGADAHAEPLLDMELVASFANAPNLL